MWKFISSKDYTRYYNKLVFIEIVNKQYGKNKIFHGILERISKPNKNNIVTVLLKYVKVDQKDSIVENLITKMYYDNSINLIGKFKIVKGYLQNKLNFDVTNEIYKYIENDIIFI